ncbi:MAG: dethiobiotin synthase [Thermoproteota archaeon]|nr:dethiobiotin synthase [Thermoproteota archaeon]
MSEGLFVTGTDTNIGKTLISASLAWKLSPHYDKICVMKPFATSDKIFSDKFNSKDLFLISKSIKLNEDQNSLNPYFYKLPASPYMASKILKTKPPSINFAFKKYKYLKKKYNFIIVEGIGGIMVPLNQKYNLVDFIKLTRLSLIIVSTPKIGTINHTLMTIQICKNYNIPIKGIIFNKMPDRPSVVEKTTPSFLEKLTKIPVLGVIPFYKNLKFNAPSFKKISNQIDNIL